MQEVVSLEQAIELAEEKFDAYFLIKGANGCDKYGCYGYIGEIYSIGEANTLLKAICLCVKNAETTQ